MATIKRAKKSEADSRRFYRDVLGGLVESITGRSGKEILDILLEKSNVNEFLIAKKLNLTINQTRNILYKLSDNGIVSFNRKKDKKKGWYTYFWTLDLLRTLEFAESRIRESMKSLHSQKKNRVSKRFYICNTCNIEVSEETALLNNFTCPECGNVYELNENHSLIDSIDSKVAGLESELSKIHSLLDIERKKIGKKIEGKSRREKEKRRKIRQEKAKKKKLEKAKLKRPKHKKSSKKKK